MYRDLKPVSRGYNRAKRLWRKLWKFRGYRRHREIFQTAAILLLALAITWPPRIEVSSGAHCRVVLTNKAAGDCEVGRPESGLATWWRACGYVEWEGRGPNGDDILAEIPLWSGDSRHKALGQCEDFLKQYEKRMKGRTSS